MHGVKRGGPTPDAAAVSKKVGAYRSVSSKVFAARASGDTSLASRSLALGLLAANPDVSTVWNYVRESLIVEFPPSSCAVGEGSPFRETVAAQLVASAVGIKRNPKSYPAWAHRVWVVGVFCARDADAVDLGSELALCAKLLAADQRNFHCWQYRRWLTDAKAALVAEHTGAESSPSPYRSSSSPSSIRAAEALYARESIELNFSNYSAWHARAFLFKRQKPPAPLDAAFLDTELRLVHRAVFTEPDDQSPWFYRRWLTREAMALVEATSASEDGTINQVVCATGQAAEACSITASTMGSATATAGAAAAHALLSDIAELGNLENAEPNCKWPIEARAQALLTLGSSHGLANLISAGFLSASDAAIVAGARASAGDAFARLALLDPRHAQYYWGKAESARKILKN